MMEIAIPGEYLREPAANELGTGMTEAVPNPTNKSLPSMAKMWEHHGKSNTGHDKRSA